MAIIVTAVSAGRQAGLRVCTELQQHDCSNSLPLTTYTALAWFYPTLHGVEVV